MKRREPNHTSVTHSRPIVVHSRQLAKFPYLALYEDLLQYKGQRAFRYTRFEMPDIVLVVAIRGRDGRMPLIKQYRHGVKREFWEFPGGFMRPREKPKDCARREFREEIGCDLDNPELIATMFPAAARSKQVAYLFSGELGMQTEDHPSPNERLKVAFVTKERALALLSTEISPIHLLAFYMTQQTYV